MNEMWEALERYQPFADQHGFGAEWRRMTTERTPGAAKVAAEAAWATPGAWEAEAAAYAAARAAAARAAYEATAIEYINEAIKLEKAL
jgi:hypothetical protein